MEGVSIITCTVRRGKLKTIFGNFNRQLHPKKELIIVLNKMGMNLKRWKRYAKKHKSIRVYSRPRLTLGACLNFAVQKANYQILAKFDDDDYYAPQYLSQALEALKTTGASIIGKMSVSTYFKGRKLLAIRKPNHENCYIRGISFSYSHLAGSTLVWKKSINRHVKFPNRNLGEDVIFQQRCERKGYKIYSTDKNYYACIRNMNKRNHTWRASDSKVLKKCKIVTYTDNYKPYIGVDNG